MRECDPTGHDPGSRPTAVVRPVRGLANRLRAVTSTMATARKQGLDFAVLWEPGRGFSDDAWEDLFANPVQSWSRARYEAALAAGVPSVRQWADDPSADAREVGRRIRERGFVFDDAFTNLSSIFSRSSLKRLCSGSSERHRVCRALRPAAPLAAVIDRFAAANFGGRRPIGVHIRRGDVVDGPTWKEYAPSSDRAFVAALERFGPRARFFLATDCEETEADFRRRFPGRLVVFGKEFVSSRWDRPKAGQRAAAVELFLLARTRRIVGTRWSSFGRMAATIGGVRFEAAVERR